LGSKVRESPLLRAARKGDLAAVRKRIRAGDDVNVGSLASNDVYDFLGTSFTIPDAGTTALMLAAFGAELAIMRALLDAGARVDVEAASHETPLTMAAHSGDVRALKLLLDRGADVNQRAGFTALHATCGEEPSPKLARFLLDRGADVDQRIWTGGTALMNATHYGQEAMVALLLDHGARVDLADDDGQTALHAACDVLLVSGMDKDPSSIAKRLLARGADPNAKDRKGNTPLHLAAKEHGERPEVTIALLGAGAKPGTKDGEGNTALFHASSLDALDVVIALLDAGAPLEESAFTNAACNGYVDLGVELLRRGAKRGNAEAIARKNGRDEFVRMLRGEIVAAEQVPRAIHAQCMEAEARYKRGDYAGAIRRYTAIPDDVIARIPSATSNLAYAFQQKKKHERAVTWFERAIAVHAEPGHLWKALCFSLSELEQWEAMERAATKAAELAPKDSYVWQQVAIARSGRKNYKGAIAAGKRAVKLNPRNAYARFNLAYDRKKAGEKNTLAEFRAAIAMEPSLAKYLDADEKRALGVR
jgi:ankyrin repeat protein